MKKLLFSAILLQSLALSSQVTLLNESFDSFEDFAITGFGEWQTLDLDGRPTYSGGGGVQWPNRFQPQAYIIFNPTVAEVTNAAAPIPPSNEVRNFDPHSGMKYAACWAAQPAGTIYNNDWLITPSLTLGTSGNELSLWVKAMSNTYGNEKYNIGIYEGDGTPSGSDDFTIISGSQPLEATYPEWEEKTFNLDAYAGKTVRIGVQCVSQDAYMFMVDDVKVTTATLSTSEWDLDKSIHVENPTSGQVKVVTDKKLRYIKVFDAVGRLVAEVHGKHEVDITKAPSGVYYLNILTDENKVLTKKLIKK